MHDSFIIINMPKRLLREVTKHVAQRDVPSVLIGTLTKDDTFFLSEREKKRTNNRVFGQARVILKQVLATNLAGAEVNKLQQSNKNTKKDPSVKIRKHG